MITTTRGNVIKKRDACRWSSRRTERFAREIRRVLRRNRRFSQRDLAAKRRQVENNAARCSSRGRFFERNFTRATEPSRSESRTTFRPRRVNSASRSEASSEYFPSKWTGEFYMLRRHAREYVRSCTEKNLPGLKLFVT